VGRSLKDALAHEPPLAAFVESAARARVLPTSAEIALGGGLAAGGRIVAASASRLSHGQEPAGLILSLTDVTEMRALEQRARGNERLAGLGGMAGGLLHELRNPLASMMLYLDLLRPLTSAAEASEILERALTEGERLTAFLEDFQVFAALRPLRLEAADIGEVATAAVAAIEWPAQTRWQWGARSPLNVRVDRRLIEHAVRNLLQNAIEALRAEGGTVKVSVTREGHEVALTVGDDGPGIPADLLERVLDPLFTTKAKGIGMGLSIVQRVVEAHGGRVVVASARGRGATFSLRLPAPVEI
jgi:signal transduction histidine kinase